ncbi:MAG: hypothetical protein WD266_02330, partial [Balneolales bacterium]
HLKIAKFLLVISALTFGISQFAYTQNQSDFQIKRSFDEDIENIYQSILEVETAEEAQELVEEVNALEDRYSDYSDFLNVLLYPETLENRVSFIDELTSTTRDRIVRIEESEGRGEDLDELISQMSDTLENRRQQIEQLGQELAQTRRARDASAGQVQNLRTALRDRDELILNLVDSLFVAYDNLDLASLSAGERRDLALEIDADNVFGHLESVIQNNVAFLDTHTQLSSEDFLRLYATYYEFNQVYGNIGPQLAQIYVGQQERQDRVQQISEMINEWGMLVDDAVWQSLNASFEQHNIELQPFSDGISFYTSLNSYLDNAISRAQDSGDSEELERYEQFSNVWEDDVKRRWQEHFINADLMTYDNFATIDSKLNTWRLASEPRSYTMLIFLGIAVLLIIGLIFLWLKEKSGTKGGGAQAPAQPRPRPQSQPPSRPAAPAPAPKQASKKKPDFPKPSEDPQAAKEREERRSKRRY